MATEPVGSVGFWKADGNAGDMRETGGKFDAESPPSRAAAPQPFTITSMLSGADRVRLACLPTMTLRLLSIPAAFVFGTALLATSAPAQTRPAAPQSPYGGTTVEDIVARVNDQIISQSDYDRAMKEMDQEGKQQGLSMQQLSEHHRDLCGALSTSSSGFPKPRNSALMERRAD